MLCQTNPKEEQRTWPVLSLIAVIADTSSVSTPRSPDRPTNMPWSGWRRTADFLSR